MAAGMSTDPLQDARQAAREQAGAVWNDTKDTARSLLGDFATAPRKAARDMDAAVP